MSAAGTEAINCLLYLWNQKEPPHTSMDVLESGKAAIARLEAVAEAASNPNLFDIDDRIAYGAQLELKAALRALDEEQA